MFLHLENNNLKKLSKYEEFKNLTNLSNSGMVGNLNVICVLSSNQTEPQIYILINFKYFLMHNNV